MNDLELDRIREVLRVDDEDWMSGEEAMGLVASTLVKTGRFLRVDDATEVVTPNGRKAMVVRVHYASRDGIKVINIRGPWQ